MHVRSMAKRNGNSVIKDPTILGLPAAPVSYAATFTPSSFPSRPTTLNVVGITGDTELCGALKLASVSVLWQTPVKLLQTKLNKHRQRTVLSVVPTTLSN